MRVIKKHLFTANLDRITAIQCYNKMYIERILSGNHQFQVKWKNGRNG